MLASMEHGDVIDALIDQVANCSDEQTRHFAIMALAQIGARDATPEAHAEAHAKLKNFLLEEMVKPKRLTHQPYGALGLAVYARNKNVQGLSAEAAQKLQETFNKTNNPSYQAAMAIGLGLLGDDAKVAQQDLEKVFTESSDQQLQGYVAVALGMMRANSNADAFRAYIQKKGLEWKLRLQLARALGLMGDVQAVDTLVGYLQTAETTSEISSSAQALGLIGDVNAVDPLLALMRNKSKAPLTRGFSCVALGIICEKADLPWNCVFSVNSNYRARTPALAELLDIL
jgi:HEAT repeat protein